MRIHGGRNIKPASITAANIAELESPITYAPGVAPANPQDLARLADIAAPPPPGTEGWLFTPAVGVVVGDAVYLSAVDTVSKAFAGTPGGTEDAIGIVTEVVGAKVRVLALGEATYAGLTPGALYFLSATTPGAITTTPPSADGCKIQRLGHAATDTKFCVQVDPCTVVL
jgi:hypothetical protein